ncbi:hypothetical protein A3194_13030 [Candidatus Thiodiazotropha endoloripes]|nr:hypothetical protein A3194_13030 [Candidatus Thiodiazotropha endoloripes]
MPAILSPTLSVGQMHVVGALIVVHSTASVDTGRFQFWPLPRLASWQYHSFWLLFRIMLFGLLPVSVGDYQSLGRIPSFLSKEGVILFTP